MAELTKEALEAAKKLWNLADFRSGIAKRRAELKGVSDDLERARRRREELRIVALPAAERAVVLMEVLEKRAARYREQLIGRLKSLLQDPFATSESPGLQMSSLLFSNQVQVSGQEMEGMIAYFHLDQLQPGLAEVAKASMSKAGPPLAEREAELKTLDTRIQELEAVEKAMLAEFEEMNRDTRR
jgi:chromosome segregation ATPase